MPFASIRLQPGQDVEQTPTYNSAGYNEMNNCRFKAGLAQKIGGWQRFFPFAVGGQAKALWAWQDLNDIDRLAVATTTEVDVITNGILIDITPQVLITNPSPDFSTVNGDQTVTIVDPNITNVTVFDSVEFLTPVSVGGIILSGLYPIATRTGAHSYTIEARLPATATVNNGGAVPVFATTLNSSSISVTLNDHAQVATNIVVFPEPTAVGGLTVNGKYNVISIGGANTFTINTVQAANANDSKAMNGGNVMFSYNIAINAPGAGIGYGLGGYGLGGFGLGGGAGPDQTGDPLTAMDYTLDNWGEILLANPEDGGIYLWQPNSGFINLSLITQAPIYNTGMFISQATQQIIAYGTSVNAWDASSSNTGVPGIGVYQDPLLLACCDISDFFDWVPTSENQAAGIRIPTGSRIISGCATKNRNLIWTDLALWALSYVNIPDVYDPNKIGDNCGIIGKHARASFSDADYWMGLNNFFVYAGGGVQIIPCSIWDRVFQDLDRSSGNLCDAGSNSDFTEITFYYPSLSGGRGYPDKWAKYNTVEGTWDAGDLDRLAWIDRSVLGNPIGVDASGLIFSHELTQDADGHPIVSNFTTGYFYLDEGQDFVIIDQIIPDFKYGLEGGSQDAQISISLQCVDSPSDTPRVNGPYFTTTATGVIDLDPPIRCRQAAVFVESSDTGSFWRLGLLRFRYTQDGRRP